MNEPWQEDEEPLCNISGKCEPFPGDYGISNCIHCGSELLEQEQGWLNSYNIPHGGVALEEWV